MTFDSLASFDHVDGRHVTRAVVSVYDNDRYVGELYPRRDYYYESGQPMTIAGVRSTMQDDFYVLLIDWQPISTQGATFKIYHNPLINWLWLGSAVFILGTMVAAWPDKEKEPAVVRQRRQVRSPVKA
jgi:cytochrome c-type biogenesis protein CcmF